MPSSYFMNANYLREGYDASTRKWISSSFGYCLIVRGAPINDISNARFFSFEGKYETTICQRYWSIFMPTLYPKNCTYFLKIRYHWFRPCIWILRQERKFSSYIARRWRSVNFSSSWEFLWWFWYRNGIDDIRAYHKRW